MGPIKDIGDSISMWMTFFWVSVPDVHVYIKDASD